MVPVVAPRLPIRCSLARTTELQTVTSRILDSVKNRKLRGRRHLGTGLGAHSDNPPCPKDVESRKAPRMAIVSWMHRGVASSFERCDRLVCLSTTISHKPDEPAAARRDRRARLVRLGCESGVDQPRKCPTRLRCGHICGEESKKTRQSDRFGSLMLELIPPLLDNQGDFFIELSESHNGPRSDDGSRSVGIRVTVRGSLVCEEGEEDHCRSSQGSY